MPELILESINDLRYKRKISYDKLKDLVSNRVDFSEKQRRSLPKVELTEIELEFLKALLEGRNQFEIMAALKFLGEKKSYHQIMGRIITKFDALTLPNAIYKAFKMGIIKI